MRLSNGDSRKKGELVCFYLANNWVASVKRIGDVVSSCLAYPNADWFKASEFVTGPQEAFDDEVISWLNVVAAYAPYEATKD